MAGRVRVALLAGGRSSEHEISLASARSVLEALDPDEYEVVTVAIGRDGRWELGSGDGSSAVAETLPPPPGLEDAVTLALFVAGFSVVVNVPWNVADCPPCKVPRLNVCGTPLCGVSVTVTL